VIVVIDYGMGNLRSAQKGLEKAGHAAMISSDPSDLERADGIVLPGVGAFKDCFDGLRERGFVDPLLAAVNGGRPLLGICVGMQMLFEGGEEGEGSPGLGILPGTVVRFPDAQATGLKVPHMGWNELEPVDGRPCPLFTYLEQGSYVYFVHSYYARPSEDELIYATTNYGIDFPAVVGRGHVFGAQFHPEKSQSVGIGILKAFGEYVQEQSASATIRAY
jgi:glutamine amidotransferase